MPPGANAPALNISRDTQNPGETLAAYSDRQMALMAKHLKGWKRGCARRQPGNRRNHPCQLPA